MKDTAISYDLVHQYHQQQHQHQPQQQQQQQPQQQHPQHHSWGHQGRHQPAHTNSVYSSQGSHQAGTGSQAQRAALGNHQQTGQHTQAQVGQYHQQLQSAAHHGSSAAAYYPHMYPAYQAHTQDQQQQQQSQQQQQQHPPSDHHHPGPNVPVSGQSGSVAGPVVGHTNIHHQQTTNTTQTSALNHGGWSPGVGSLTPQGHHAVVTDHSTMAYMTHPYQSHNNSTNDHRGSEGPITSQTLSSAPQTTSYTVDTIYNAPTAAAVAAAAAYGYNNYNAAFFQTSDNGPHSQAGHPSQANMSTFWGHNQATQQRTGPSQGVNQISVQQRQPIVSEPATSYIHDPRLYYGRPYGQNLQNFGHTQAQADVMHQRMTTMPQQHQLLQHHDHLQQVAHQAIQPQSMTNHHSSSNHGQQQSNPMTLQQAVQPNQSVPNHVSDVILNGSQVNRQIPVMKPSPNSPIQRPNSGEIHSLVQNSNQSKQSDYDQINSASSSESSSVAHQSVMVKDNMAGQQGSQSISNAVKEHVKPIQPASESSANKTPFTPQNVIKSDFNSQYPRKNLNQETSQVHCRTIYRGQSDEQTQSQTNNDTIKLNNPIGRDLRSSNIDSKLASPPLPQQPPPSTNKQSTEQTTNTLEDGMASLALTSRKTTWASIASQPAKVTQPKSLKSKIAGPNSVLSSAKHLAVVSLDTSSMDSKNGINPAIKNSVSTAATSIQRSSIPPPIAKLPAVAASLKLDLLSDTMGENSKISWPAVNASVNLSSGDTTPREANTNSTSQNYNSNDFKGRDESEQNKGHPFKDLNHNQSSGKNLSNNYSMHEQSRDSWTRRDHRDRRDSERRDDHERRRDLDYPDGDSRDHLNSRREFRGGPRMNHYRDDQYRDRDHMKRGPMIERNKHRGGDNYQNSRFQPHRYEPHHVNHNQGGSGPRHGDSFPHQPKRDTRDGESSIGTAASSESSNSQMNPSNYNPETFDLELKDARYFIIKSYSGDDIHKSIKYSIWCSTNHGNKRLDEAFKQQQAKNAPIYLFFSVNGSGHFCGVAQMTTAVDFESSLGVWAQSKWQGEFSVKWIYVKNVPNGALRHITLENNEDKPVTNSRDTQEVPSEKGKSVLKIIHQHNHSSSIFDDFLHYERRQEEDRHKRPHPDQPHNRPEDRDRPSGGNSRFGGRPYMNSRPHNDYQGNRGGGRIVSHSRSNQMMDKPYGENTNKKLTQ